MENKKTVQNLMNSFAGESQAFQRYAMYAKVAQKEGWANISEIFNETALNEQQHAKEFYKLLVSICGGEKEAEKVLVSAEYPVSKGDTYNNLVNAMNGEKGEVEEYLRCAEVAQEEGFKEAALKFKLIAEIEQHHADRYEKISKLLKADEMLKRDKKVKWKCMKCGYIYEGEQPPKVCPVCGHVHGYFEEYTAE